MLKELEHKVDQLGPAEARLAKAILREPRAVTQMSLASFASQVGVSEPTVIRLCRKLGCTGFPDFKLRLAEQIAAGTPYVHREVNPGDALPVLSAKVVGSAISTLVSLGESLDSAAVERAVVALSQAHRIDLFATGPSSVIAFDAQQKFIYLEVPAIFQHDIHLQIMSARGLASTGVALCFSFTGQTIDIVQCAQEASIAGATVISVTRKDSALAKASSIAIPVDTVENTFFYSPMTTRLAHLAVVDILATAVALRRGPGISHRIKTMKETLLRKRITD